MKQGHTIAILGPTASGKSQLAMKLAREQGGEIVSCDSVQVYKGFDIGSAKPSLEEQKEIRHHMLDLVSWAEDFDAARYRDLARNTIADILRRGKLPIIVGGSILYYRALCGQSFHDLPSDQALRAKLKDMSNEELANKLRELDPERAKEIHPNDRFRLIRTCEIAILTGRTLKQIAEAKHPSTFRPKELIVLNLPVDSLENKIRERSQAMLKNGLIEEVRGLLTGGCPPSAKPMQSIGYKQVCEYLQGQIPENDLLEKIVIATRQYARKQNMWLRSLSH